MIYILGGDGFIGSAFTRELASRGIEHTTINRDNYHIFKGTECSLLINANGNSKKYLADKNPVLDFELSVNSVLDSLINFKYKKYIYLSSGDVYLDQSTPEVTKEDQVLDISNLSRYGLHKAIAEQLVKNYAPNWLIFRMGGFIGKNLAKNAVFDLLNNYDVWLSSKSELQFICTDEAAKIILNIAAQDLNYEVINLGGDGVINIDAIYKKTGSTSKYKIGAKNIRYELNLQKLKNLIKKDIPKTEDMVIDFLNKFHQNKKND